MDMNNMGQIMEQAKMMQEQMQKAQEELTEMVVVGEAGAGMVKVTMNGRHDCQKVEINDNLFKRTADADAGNAQARRMVEELVAAAINDAVRKIEDETRGKMMAMAKSMNLPEDFQLPVDEQ